MDSKKNEMLKIVVINALVTFGIVTLVVAGFMYFPFASDDTNSDSQNRGNILINQQGVRKVINEENAIIDVVEKSDPAVVSIIVTQDLQQFEEKQIDPFFNEFFQDPFFRRYGVPELDENTNDSEDSAPQQREIGGGSGFLVTEDGLIVTNKHVVENEDANYTILINTGEKYEAEVLAKDPVNDIAILKVILDEGQEGTEFPVLPLGESAELKVGQSVVAIGNALAEYRNTVSTGIVSGLQRNIRAGSGFSSQRIDGVIQTDAAINRGNSGGPLLNLAGEVIGVNVAIAQGAQNIGFSIPIDSVKSVIEMVKENGRIVRPFLGVRYIMVTPGLQQRNNLPVDYGVLVIRGYNVEDIAVVPGSPADKAGIVENDIILEFNGVKLTPETTLAREIMKYTVGDEVEIKYWHKGDEKTETVLLVDSQDLGV